MAESDICLTRGLITKSITINIIRIRIRILIKHISTRMLKETYRIIQNRYIHILAAPPHL